MNQSKDQVRAHNKEVADMFNDMPPFTIKVNSGEDASWLSSAMLLFMTNGNDENADRGLKLMLAVCRKEEVEAGVNMFFDMANEEKIFFQAFVRPVFKLMVGHALEKYKNNEAGE